MCLRIADGGIFGWLDSDDFYNPDAIATIVDWFNINKSAMLVYGGLLPSQLS